MPLVKKVWQRKVKLVSGCLFLVPGCSWINNPSKKLQGKSGFNYQQPETSNQQPV